MAFQHTARESSGRCLGKNDKKRTALPDDPQSKTVSNDDLRMMLAGALRLLNARLLTTITNSVDDHNAIMPMNFITNTTDTSAMNPIVDPRFDHFWQR